MAVTAIPVSIKMPPVCPRCGRTNTITLEHTIAGQTVTVFWRCAECTHSWPVTGPEVH